MTEYYIIDNFLDKNTFKNIRSEIMSTSVPWTFCPQISTFEDKSGHSYFIHTLFENYRPISRLFDIVAPPLFSKLKDVNALLRMKINLYTKTENLQKHGLHIDYPIPHKGAVFYINTCNGYTGVGNEKIFSVENRILKFDSSNEHHSTNCTDEQARLTININYF